MLNKLLSKFLITLLFLTVIATSFVNIDYANAASKDNEKLKQPKTNSKSIAVIDAKNGNLIYSKESDMTIYPASTGKVLTAIVALENSKITDEITVPVEALKGQEKGGAHIALKAGEKITMEDALYGLLLASGNDCAISIAYHVSGSEKEFAKLLNAKAVELNLINSHFVTASGLYDKNHFSCATDLGLITNYAIKNPDFLKIFSSLKYVVKPTNKDKKPKELYNGHRMVRFKSYAYKGVVGGKRGYITESKYNLITYAKRGDTELIVVTCKGKSQKDNLDDTKKLFNYYFKNYKFVDIDDKINGEPIKNVLKTKGYLLSRSEIRNENITALLPKDKEPSDVKLSFVANTGITYPIAKGAVVGEISILCDRDAIGSVPLYAFSDIQSPKDTKIRILIIVGISLIVLSVLLFIAVLFLKQNQRRQAHIRAKRKRRQRRKL